jgi:phosphoribosylanthranilate isomerase
MLVKICGITRLDDAEAAVDAGANALGFIFWPGSPRFIDPYRARAITGELPWFVAAVGVFVNQPREYVASVASLAHLGAVQMHGDETVADALAVRRPVIKALTLDEASHTDRLNAWPARVTVLLDVHDPARRGGTGQTIDWAAAAAIASRRRVVLAGGLSPDNVAEAVARVRPFGIDVSSGVESSPGRKDHGRLRSLFEVLRARCEITAFTAEDAADAEGHPVPQRPALPRG